jgi:predicted SprT family Zn-dependent metalloprotease
MKDRVLEIPKPELIEPELLREVFDHEEFLEIRTAVSLMELGLRSRIEEFGFVAGREFGRGRNRMQRFRLSRFEYVKHLSEQLMKDHGLGETWNFVFDSAKQRAGLCNYTDFEISLSKYIVEHHSIDQSIQVVLHEIAHALAGKSAGHGPNWKKIAKSLGYRGEKFTGKEIAEQTARWVGECRNGHRHYRFKSPKVQLACGYCGKGFNPRYLINWTDRAA